MAGRPVILYSGGMDSYCMSRLCLDHGKQPDLLFIDTGTADNEMERKRLPGYVNQISFPMAQWELPNKIVPFRNCFFVLVAAQHYSDIYLGATAGDTTKDKDFVFKAMMESLLNYFAGDSDSEKMGHGFRPHTIHLPFKEMTKTQILAEYIDEGFDVERLLSESRSCYQGKTEKECGRCRSCLRKCTALINNHIPIAGVFNETPSFPALTALLEESKAKGRHREVLDIENAILTMKEEG